MPDIFDKWQFVLMNSAKSFYEMVCSLNEEYRAIVEYHEEVFDKVHERYLEYREKLHNIVTGDLIDRHKVLASILLAFMDKDNLIFQINKEAVKNSSINTVPFWVMFPNEYYLCQIMLPILSEFVISSKKFEKFKLKIDEYDIQFPDKITCWETEISKQYTEHFIELLAILIMENDNAIKCLLIISHLMFFYELAYDCAKIEQLKQSYYKYRG